MGVFVHRKSHYKFFSLSMLIFFLVSHQFSASLTFKAWILRVENYYSEVSPTGRYPQNSEMCSHSATKDQI